MGLFLSKIVYCLLDYKIKTQLPKYNFRLNHSFATNVTKRSIAPQTCILTCELTYKQAAYTLARCVPKVSR